MVGVLVGVEAEVANFYDAWSREGMLPYSKPEFNWKIGELLEGGGNRWSFLEETSKLR